MIRLFTELSNHQVILALVPHNNLKGTRQMIASIVKTNVDYIMSIYVSHKIVVQSNRAE